MEITLNGQLVTCTPEEYAKLVQLGLVPSQSAGTHAAPITIKPPTTLPDDIVKLPDTNAPYWKNDRCDVVPVYGCQVVADTVPLYGCQIPINKPIQVPTVELAPSIAKPPSTPEKKTITLFVLKKADEEKYWAASSYQYFCDHVSDAKVFYHENAAKAVAENLKNRFGEFDVKQVER